MRIKQIAQMIDKCKTVADIGTDHGYVAEIILEEKKCEYVIATDLNEGPLNNARKYLKLNGLEKKVDFRLGNGLEIIKPGEVDIIVIAGMGGILINNILEDSKNVTDTASKIVLQPMTAADKVRKYLYENNYKIESESLVKEYYHYYQIIKAVHGYEKVEDPIYFEISKFLLKKKDELIGEFIDNKIETNKKIIKNIENINTKEINDKRDIIQNKIKRYMELKEEYEIN